MILTYILWIRIPTSQTRGPFQNTIRISTSHKLRLRRSARLSLKVEYHFLPASAEYPGDFDHEKEIKGHWPPYSLLPRSFLTAKFAPDKMMRLEDGLLSFWERHFFMGELLNFAGVSIWCTPCCNRHETLLSMGSLVQFPNVL